MTWILEPRGDDDGHVLVNRTSAPAYGVSATALDRHADQWHAARPRSAPGHHAAIAKADGSRVADGEDVEGWEFTPGPDSRGVLEVQWSDLPGGTASHTHWIDVAHSRESFPAAGPE